MPAISEQFALTFRDFTTDGIATSGRRDVDKAEARAIGPLIEQAIGNVGLGALISARFETLAAANAGGASLAYPAGAVALIWNDSNNASNDLAIKSGASGAGSWTPTTIIHDIIGGVANPLVSLAQAWAEGTLPDGVGTDSAKGWAAAAQAAAAYAEEFSAPAFTSISDGVAGTTAGKFFRVSNGDTPQTYTRYERTSTSPYYVQAASLATTADLASVLAGKGIDLVSRVPYPAASRGAIKGLDTSRYQVAHLLETGRWGLFQWIAGDFSAHVAADPLEIAFVKSTAVSASVGVWVRQYDMLRPEMAGAPGGGTIWGIGPDNTAAVQGLFNLLDYLPKRVIWLDDIYVCSTTTSRIGGSLTRTLECWSDNVSLDGPGCLVGVNSNVNENNWRFVLFGGAGKIAAGTGDITTQRCIDKAGVAITGPIAEGATTAPVAAGAEAEFAPGDVVLIRTGQLLSTGVTEPKAELSVVRSVASGQVLLNRPTTHDYAQEYFISGTEGLTSTTVTANAARYEIVKVTDRVQRNLRIRGLKFRQPSLAGTGVLTYANLASFPGAGNPAKVYVALDTWKYYRWDGFAYVDFTPFTQCVSLWGILGLDLDCDLDEYPCAGMGWRDCSDAVVNAELWHNGIFNKSYGIHPSTGCTRLTLRVRQSSAGFNTVNLHESVGDVLLTLSTTNVGGVGETYGGFNIANRARNVNAMVSVDIGVSTQNAVQNIDGTDMKNVVIEVRTNGNVRDDSGNILFLNRGVQGRVSMRGAQLASPVGSRGQFVILSGWVTSAKNTCILGVVPQDAIVVQAGTSVWTAISGGSSSRVDAGYVGGTGKEVINGAICNTSATGRTLDANQTANGAGPGMAIQTTSSRNLKASFTDNTATAGVVLVYAVYFIAARRD